MQRRSAVMNQRRWSNLSVSPRRMPRSAIGKTDPELVRVWTIQHVAAWERLQRAGVLQADGRRVWRCFRPAYSWLIEQMQHRLPDYSGRYPIWVWISPKPDLRRTAFARRGQQRVRIEAELPRDRLLSLDFNTWHCVLNNWHLSLSEWEDGEWDRRTRQFARGSLPPALEAERRASWERVFDLASLRRSSLWGSIDTIQGVTEFIRLEEVRRVDFFVAR